MTVDLSHAKGNPASAMGIVMSALRRNATQRMAVSFVREAERVSSFEEVVKIASQYVRLI